MEAMTAPTPARIINIAGLGLAFEQDGQRTQVLQGLDLDICAGEFIAIVGASGVGKSTLLRVLMDLAKPTAGTVTITPIRRPSGPWPWCSRTPACCRGGACCRM